jgi:hypothetical protein
MRKVLFYLIDFNPGLGNLYEIFYLVFMAGELVKLRRDIEIIFK